MIFFFLMQNKVIDIMSVKLNYIFNSMNVRNIYSYFNSFLIEDKIQCFRQCFANIQI